MRISDWSSDVCSSDLLCRNGRRLRRYGGGQRDKRGRGRQQMKFHDARSPAGLEIPAPDPRPNVNRPVENKIACFHASTHSCFYSVKKSHYALCAEWTQSVARPDGEGCRTET